MERGDLAEFGKKRNTDDDFPPHWKCGSENNKIYSYIFCKNVGGDLAVNL